MKPHILLLLLICMQWCHGTNYTDRPSKTELKILHTKVKKNIDQTFVIKNNENQITLPQKHAIYFKEESFKKNGNVMNEQIDVSTLNFDVTQSQLDMLKKALQLISAKTKKSIAINTIWDSISKKNKTDTHALQPIKLTQYLGILTALQLFSDVFVQKIGVNYKKLSNKKEGPDYLLQLSSLQPTTNRSPVTICQYNNVFYMYWLQDQKHFILKRYDGSTTLQSAQDPKTIIAKYQNINKIISGPQDQKHFIVQYKDDSATRHSIQNPKKVLETYQNLNKQHDINYSKNKIRFIAKGNSAILRTVTPHYITSILANYKHNYTKQLKWWKKSSKIKTPTWLKPVYEQTIKPTLSKGEQLAVEYAWDMESAEVEGEDVDG